MSKNERAYHYLLALILITASLNIGVDILGRFIRRKLALQTMPTC
jgi:phosphonate transport system permease protein